jgi:hypothetical protein
MNKCSNNIYNKENSIHNNNKNINLILACTKSFICIIIINYALTNLENGRSSENNKAVFINARCE